jgi:RNA polymerase sigma-70 factor (ECF subfamily)
VGSQDFVREVYDASYRRLVAQLYALCGDQHDAEEIVQEAFVKAVRQSSAFAAVDNPEAWLRTVSVNLLRSRWRRSALWRGLLPRLPGAAHTAELSSDHVALVEALGRLPLALREVVVLHHVADLPTREVATTLGVAEGTVKSRLVKARSMLATALAEDEESNHA